MKWLHNGWGDHANLWFKLGTLGRKLCSEVVLVCSFIVIFHATVQCLKGMDPKMSSFRHPDSHGKLGLAAYGKEGKEGKRGEDEEY